MSDKFTIINQKLNPTTVPVNDHEFKIDQIVLQTDRPATDPTVCASETQTVNHPAIV